MAMTLQEAIDFATAPPVPTPFGIEVIVVITMHDDANVGTVLVGEVGGFTDMFRPDLPLLNWGTIAGVSAGNLPVSPFPVVAPGFSTRGLSDAFGSLRVAVGSGFGTSFMIDFSVRSDPGFHGVGAGIQIEIETLSGTTRFGATPTSGIKLEVAEDGALLRAVGPSLQDLARTASYTATMFVHARIG
jgi:hypothetical protein